MPCRRWACRTSSSAAFSPGWSRPRRRRLRPRSMRWGSRCSTTGNGVSPEHFGVVMVLNLMIGLLTPPVGLCLYAISSISRVPMGELFFEMWPYIVALLVVLGIVTYVPDVSLWLPKFFGFEGG